MEPFNKLLTYLKNKNIYAVDLLQPGLPENTIQQMLSTKGLQTSFEVEELYRGINGIKEVQVPLGLYHLFPYYILLSLEKSLELYDEECIDYGSREEGFLPIFWDGNRDYLLVDCLSHNKGVFFYSAVDFRFDKVKRIYDSLDHLFATVLQCFELGAYRLGRKLEDIHYDGEFVFSISRKMNPNSPFWQLDL